MKIRLISTLSSCATHLHSSSVCNSFVWVDGLAQLLAVEKVLKEKTFSFTKESQHLASPP